MNRHLFQGIVAGVLFAIPITSIAAMDAVAEGDLVTIVPSVLFGLAAGLCIGALIAANFAMLDVEEKEHVPAQRMVEAHNRA
ncbi:MAG TPA: hypothetical protein VEI95_07005 [Acidobacteriota bacterium]|jgi:hypothetical protein|nr:hypothetical protein [Acidobacteriota bacterium]